MHILAYANARARLYAHRKYMNKHKIMHTHKRVHTRTHVCAHKQPRSHTHIRTDTHTHADTDTAYICKYTWQICICAQGNTHTCIHPCTHICAYKHKYPDIRTEKKLRMMCFENCENTQSNSLLKSINRA